MTFNRLLFAYLLLTPLILVGAQDIEKHEDPRTKDPKSDDPKPEDSKPITTTTEKPEKPTTTTEKPTTTTTTEEPTTTTTTEEPTTTTTTTEKPTTTTTTTEKPTTTTTTTEETTTEQTTTTEEPDPTDPPTEEPETTDPPTTVSVPPQRTTSKPKAKSKDNQLPLIIGLSAGVFVLIVLISCLFALFYYRHLKNKQKYEEEQASRHQEVEAGFHGHKVGKRFKPGDVIPGAAPPGPIGWEPEHLEATQFKHMGPLKIDTKQPFIMEHELENETSEPSGPDQHVVWSDEENKVYDIGSEVEQLYRDGKRIA